jgi:hypothetical protein
MTRLRAYKKMCERYLTLPNIFFLIFSVALKNALKIGIKTVKNRAKIVKKQEHLNLCFDLS